METEKLKKILERRVLVLDGAMGTMIQRYSLDEDGYRGGRWRLYNQKLQGCNDLLCLTRPELIKRIHKAYIEAGADIISTDTFNANAISMADYGLDKEKGLVKEINKAGATIALEAAIEAGPCRDLERVLVAGSIGPTNRTASMSPDVNDPALRTVTYDRLYDAYTEQIEGLVEGGVDLLLFETVFDTLNLKAGLAAANDVMDRLGNTLPILVSATVSDKSGRTLSGQTINAFVTSIEDFDNVVSIGLNCSFGPSDILPYIREMSYSTHHFVSCHPNAGLPNALGEYDETPESFAGHIRRILDQRLVNIIGGCCGTTPSHVKEIAEAASMAEPRKAPEIIPALRVSGLERLTITPENNFVNVGERCNVAGSRKFLRLIKEKNYEEAMGIAARQVEQGAMIIDVNMDDSLIDARGEMVHFLRYIASDPEIAKVPVMIDSSDWNVVESALKNLQGKSIVNSISLKGGEALFKKQAMRIRGLGSAVIVMAFDEKGQADTYERKIEICERAYRILTRECGFNPQDIIFDVNIMAVATGIEEHNRYGIDFIKAVKWVKENLPGARTSGGVSNLSFAFRGKNSLREAMHAVFLYHAIKNGLDMAILNPATNVTYDEIEPDLLRIIEDVVLARRPEASNELAAYATQQSTASGAQESNEDKRDLTIPVADRITDALVKGNPRFLTEDIDEALYNGMTAVEIIEKPLMSGMNRVGELFGDGKMFLPQVVKSARTMKMAVDRLAPSLAAGKSDTTGKQGKVVFATVKGDVHDIGKNICSIVLACNNFEVIDLGVMVSPETILATVRRERPDILCLSGLITPSLAEMANVAKMLKDAGENLPILVGGAATSKLHTALKISPEYEGAVIHMRDASQNPIVAARLLDKTQAGDFAADIKKEYNRLAETYQGSIKPLVPLAEARRRGERNRIKGSAVKPLANLGEPVVVDVPIEEVIPLINWKMFFHAWKVNGNEVEEEKLKTEALQFLGEVAESGKYDGRGAVAFYKAYSEDDNLIVDGTHIFPMLRQQSQGSSFRSLVDYFVRKDEADDYVGIFAATAGGYLTKAQEGEDSYGMILRSTIADRLAEATSEWLHDRVRREYWGYAQEEKTPAELLGGENDGIRPAMGYPMLPDQLLNHNLATLLPLDKLGINMTENGAMSPSSSVSGLYVGRKEATYFMIGDMGEDQVSDYARRRGLPESRIKEILRQ